MKVEIMIVSYLADLPWLEFNLRSIRKFALGFYTTLVVPAQEELSFVHLVQTLRFPITVKTYDRVADPAKWHLAHQVEKCRADIHCPDADFILHTDSDCVFTELVTPDDYFVNGKPVMLIEDFARLPGNPWQTVVSSALNWPVQFETMRRHPQVNPRGIYFDVRHHIEQTHGLPFEVFVLSRKANFPWGFTEHCTIGAYALGSRWGDKYHWIDVAHDQRPADKLAQFWSHSPPHLVQDLPSGGRGVPLETMQRLGLC